MSNYPDNVTADAIDRHFGGDAVKLSAHGHDRLVRQIDSRRELLAADLKHHIEELHTLQRDAGLEPDVSVLAGLEHIDEYLTAQFLAAVWSAEP